MFFSPQQTCETLAQGKINVVHETIVLSSFLKQNLYSNLIQTAVKNVHIWFKTIYLLYLLFEVFNIDSSVGIFPYVFTSEIYELYWTFCR